MTLLPANFYAAWRAQRAAGCGLHDESPLPPERLLQAIWQHQRLRREQLVTLDGRPVRVLHPGFGSAEGGPDFRGAVIRIGEDSPQTGDVEVDLRATGWRAHGHDRNPSFRNVILHVVWEAERAVAPVPVLALRQRLDAPLEELSLWLENDPPAALPEAWRGKCSAPLQALPEDDLTTLLREAARVRLQAKAAQLQARAREAGWEQALWEGLFRALGYKHNVWPMHNLAEMRVRWSLPGSSVLQLQARLLGLSGLLPPELTRRRSSGDSYLRSVWDGWWRERDSFGDCLLPRGLWRMHGLRPANQPVRRLALAAHWIHAGTLPSQLQHWCAANPADHQLVESLLELLRVAHDDFWSWHWTLRSARLPKPQPLLGGPRVTDLALNVILPWLWTRAAEGSNQKLQRELERRYFAWPAAEDNAVLRLARQRLLGRRRGDWKCAALQQGLLQILRDFCDHSNALCDDCQFPRLVREFSRRPTAPPAAQR